MTPKEILLKYWGYTNFREKQEDIVQSVLDGKDTLALLPTGGGKSICFQVPALAMEGVCIVISPLIALMKDQVDNLKKRGIKAIAITSSMRKREIDIALDNIAYGDYKFLYVSPERLATELFIARVKKMNVNLIAVDESHCISQWGYDFRPSYLNISELRTLLPKAPVLALTATATPDVTIDIQEKLAFKQPNIIQKSFVRKNLAYVVQEENDQLGRLKKVLEGIKGSGIVYTNSRKQTQTIAAYLNRNGYSADFYHAGLSHQERDEKQQNWITNKIRVIVATNAFGMGIDKPDVRFVVHLTIPETLEAYFQEAGRGGRDLRKAYAVLLYNSGMITDFQKKIEQKFPPIKAIKNCYQALANFLQIPVGAGEGETTAFDLAAFSKRYNFHPIEAYHSLKFLEKEGYISLSENFHSPSKIMMVLNKEDLYRFQVANMKYDQFIRFLLRSYEGLFDGFSTINEFDIAKKTNLSRKAIVDLLNRLKKLKVIDYIEQSSLPQLTLITERMAIEDLRISKENYAERKKIAQQKMKAVIDFVTSHTRCRSSMLLHYFGEMETHRCGVCDICLEQNKLDLNELQLKELSKLIQETITKEPLPIYELPGKIKRHKKEDVLSLARYLVDNGEIFSIDGVLQIKPE
jgi:ATP-dependent DNA helicase RecQ